MPSHRCRHPTCTVYLPAPGHCPDHAGAQPLRNAHYDATERDRELKRFYDSAGWQLARRIALARRPWCNRCGRMATMAHHRSPARTDPASRLLQENLQCLCNSCHSALEREISARSPNVH
jgi:hypothetical protein